MYARGGKMWSFFVFFGGCGELLCGEMGVVCEFFIKFADSLYFSVY